MRKSILLGTIAALGLAGPVLANDDLSYTYVEGGYFNADDVNLDGFELKGSYGFTDLLHGFAGYSDGEFDGGGDFKVYEVGLGLNYSLSSIVDAIGTVSYLNADYTGGDDDGYKVGARLRGKLGGGFELEGGVNYVDLNDAGDDTSFDIGGRYFFTPAFAVGANVEFDDGDQTWRVSARYNFPKR